MNTRAHQYHGRLRPERTVPDHRVHPVAEERARELKDQIRDIEAEQEGIEAQLRDLLLSIPNLPDDSAPDGDSEEFAIEVRRVGTPPAFTFEPKDHVDLGEATGILDCARATKLSGPRFAVSRGAGAALERALASNS